MATHHYTDKTYYYYDATLTQDLLTKYINTLSSSSQTKTDTTYLPWGGHRQYVAFHRIAARAQP